MRNYFHSNMDTKNRRRYCSFLLHGPGTNPNLTVDFPTTLKTVWRKVAKADGRQGNTGKVMTDQSTTNLLTANVVRAQRPPWPGVRGARSNVFLKLVLTKDKVLLVYWHENTQDFFFLVNILKAMIVKQQKQLSHIHQKQSKGKQTKTRTSYSPDWLWILPASTFQVLELQARPLSLMSDHAGLECICTSCCFSCGFSIPY